MIAFKCGKKGSIKKKEMCAFTGQFSAAFVQNIANHFFLILGQLMLYNLHTQKNKWNNLANANIKSMKLGKALSIWMGQLTLWPWKWTFK